MQRSRILYQFLVWRMEPASAERIWREAQFSRGAALAFCAARFDTEQVDRAVFVLKPPAAGVGQIGRLRAKAIDPTKRALARIGRILEPRRNHGAGPLSQTL